MIDYQLMAGAFILHFIWTMAVNGFAYLHHSSLPNLLKISSASEGLKILANNDCYNLSSQGIFITLKHLPAILDFLRLLNEVWHKKTPNKTEVSFSYFYHCSCKVSRAMMQVQVEAKPKHNK
uniref:Uncharacterized protein n=1 Tax=Glossina pallidipes TaxID=7398 RepID=A0A1B0AJ56_GLOPL